jgi:Uma2 family endonuclease
MTPITQLSQLDLNANYSYADYLTWQLEETVELIKGKIMAMSPAPNVKHQSISRNMLVEIANHLHKKPCKVFQAPFDVKLYDSRKSQLSDREVFSVVQPDLCVIGNSETTPNWIIEVLTLGDNMKDVRLKFELYQECHIREYWIIHPYSQTVYQFVLNHEDKYQLHAMYAGDDIATPYLFPELKIDLADVFAE